MTKPPRTTAARGKSWRDGVKIHPAADLFPMLPAAELRVLADDIKVNGLRHPPVYFVDRTSRHFVLDGRNRLAAMALAGLRTDTEGKIVKEGEVDPYAYVVSANLHRRHLTGEQRRDVVAALLKAKPERSDNATAKLAKVSDKTVADVRRGMETTSEIPKLDARVGADGKVRSRRSATRASAIAIKPPAVKQLDQAPEPSSANEDEPDADDKDPNVIAALEAHRARFKLLSSSQREKFWDALRMVTRPPKRSPSRNERWREHVEALLELQAEAQSWLDNMPENFASGEKAEQLQSIIDIDLSELETVEFPGMLG